MTSENMQNQSPDVGTTTAADAAEPNEVTVASVTTSQVIRKAADILAQAGWCQGSWASQDGRVCAFLAILQAEKEFTGVQGIHGLTAAEYMRRFTGALSLPAYNDLYSTTYEDVQALFKRAADLAESEGD
jgi:hypothetical protein